MPKSAKSSLGSYRTAGRTSDGVTILAPKSKPTHFTKGEMRSTIQKVLRDSASGRFQTTTSGSSKDQKSRKG